MSNLTIIFGVSYVLLVLFSINKVLRNIKSQSRSISWIFAILFIPFGGVLFYYVFGKKKRRDRLLLGKNPFYNNGEEIIIPEFLEAKKQLVTMLDQNNSSSITYDNEVTIFQESELTFETIYKCIKNAKVSVHLEFYIVEDGIILDRLIDLFHILSEQGVSVRLIVDGYGSYDLSKKSKAAIKKANVEIREFMPSPFFKLFKYANNRNHRKSIIIDNKIAFTGGFNIMDSYLKPEPKIGLRKDTFVQLVGGAAADLNKVFLADWQYCGGTPFQQQTIIEDSSPSNIPVHITSSSPISRFQSIMQVYFSIIADAEDYIYIVTPYFSPNSSIMTALKTTALSGVNVQLMLPFQSDSTWTRHCMFSYIEELLAAQVKIYLYREGFMHSKIVICDDIISSVGSANFDERSFDANFEVNALIYSKDITQEFKNRFIRDKANCEELKIESFVNRVGRSKFLESLARLTSPLL